MALSHCLSPIVSVSAVLAVACGTPARLDDVTPINRLRLTESTLFDGSRSHRLFRIFDITSPPEQQMLELVTSRGAMWLLSNGTVARKVDFNPVSEAAFPVCALRDGETRSYAAVDSSEQRLVFFDDGGGVIATHRTGNYPGIIVADLAGDRRDRLVSLSLDGKSLAVFDPDGQQERTYPTRGHARDVAALRLPGDRTDSLAVYASPDPEWPESVRIISADGAERAKWPIAAEGAIVVSRVTDGRPVVVSVDHETLVEWDPLTGEEVSRVSIPRADAFRQIRVARWRQGTRIVVLSGPAITNKHMIVVVDRQGAIVFRKIGDGRSYALLASSEEGDAFYVGVEGRLIRYGVAK